MTAFTSETLESRPRFDAAAFMRASQESRLERGVEERLTALWNEWLPRLTVKILSAGGSGCLLAWLGESVEASVDGLWSGSPSEAYMRDALAQTLCMAAARAAVPQIEAFGCAPAPEPTDALRAALEAEGVPYLGGAGPALSRRYAVLTHYPFKGGCGVCFLRDGCPEKRLRSRAGGSAPSGRGRGDGPF